MHSDMKTNFGKLLFTKRSRFPVGSKNISNFRWRGNNHDISYCLLVLKCVKDKRRNTVVNHSVFIHNSY